MTRPLIMVALLHALGILLARAIAIPLSWLFAAAFALAWTALLVPKLRPSLLWPLVPLLGGTSFATDIAVLSPNDLRRIFGVRIEYVSLRGTLCETPVQRLFERDHQPSWRTLAQVQVDAARSRGAWQPAFGRVAVSTPGLLDPKFFARQRIEVTGILRPPKSRAAEGLFDYRAYLGSQNIYHQLAVESTNDWSILPGVGSSATPPLSDRFLAWAQKTLAKGMPAEDEPLRLLWAMTLGWKTALTGEVSEPFMRNGTLHIFAISGLHIALIAGILVRVLRVLQLPRAACGLLIVPALWFYTAATGWQSSAIRSTIMMSIIIGGWALNRPSDLLNSLAAAGLIILLWEPQQLFQAGFQLSFFVVLSIALFVPLLEKFRARLCQSDPFLPRELRPRWQRWLDTPVRHITTSAATSLAAWLGSLPLIAYYFYLITPVSLLANLIIVPLSSLALMASLGSLLCGDWLPWFTILFNHSAWFWMRIMIALSDWTAGLPGAYFYVRPPSLVQCAAYYLLLGGLLSGWFFARPRRKWAALAIGLIAGVWGLHWLAVRNEVRLAILPLGGGPLLVDRTGQASDLLIDCGDRSAAEFVLKPFLRSQGLNRLPQVLLTHGDLHHVGGMDYLADHFSIAQVFTSSVRFRSPTYRRIVDGLERTSQRWRQINRGDSLDGWRVLHPDAQDRFAQADDNALVLLGEFHGTRLLLLSDLGKLGQRKLLEREKDLRAEIVVAGLPTQAEPLGNALLEAIQPRLIVVASAEFPIGTRASPRLRERLRELGIPVVYTSEEGAVTLRFRPRGWDLRTMNGTCRSAKAHDPSSGDASPRHESQPASSTDAE